MSKDNGGPAFPCSVRRSENYMDEGGYGRVRMVTVQEGGLSMRDYFAAKAMQALIPLFSSGTLSVKDGTPATEAHVSEQAYAFADAMLEARVK